MEKDIVLGGLFWMITDLRKRLETEGWGLKVWRIEEQAE